ncbi:MAG: signal peptide peptidase SppA [Acidobacteriaceae bacterium]|nr:signal peptide peptidase SppA [Acidobacteriaceae bacterium]
MGRFLIGIVVGVVVTILALVVITFAIARIFQSKKTVIPGNAVLVLNLEGNVPEAAPVEIPIPFIQSRAMPTVRDVWASLREAAGDSRIKAIVIAPRGLTVGWGRLEELHHEILAFKKSGKPVYALLAGAGSREYYLASAAEKIYISPDDLLEVKGFRIESTFFKNALDRLGVNVQVDHIGRFKDAGDMFTRTDMSPETREVLSQVLDQIYGDFCTTAGAGRHKSGDEIRALIDQGPFLAPQAKSGGLVDEIGYEDQVYSDLKKKTGQSDLKKVEIKTYAAAVPHHGDKIAFLVGEGDIVRAQTDGTSGSEEVLSSGAMTKLIRQIRDDKDIKGVILRVDSPGGDAIASDIILHELKLLSRQKPLAISFSDVAASGGYFISMTGDPIVSYPNTLTGSIGVLYVRPNIHGLFDKLGIREDFLTRGRMADMDSFYLPLSDAAHQKLHDEIQATYQSFVSKVATARRRSYDQIDPLAQGRVWMGQQARQNGLVDELGGLDRAVALIRQRAKLSATGDTDLVIYPPRRSLIEILTTSSSEAFEERAIERKLRSAIPDLPSPSLLKGGLLRIMPYHLTVQ